MVSRLAFAPGASDLIPGVGVNQILIATAQTNGGTTKTHALPAGSPAIDAAPSADCTPRPVDGLDQRGKPRNANGKGGASMKECDIGAFERQP